VGHTHTQAGDLIRLLSCLESRLKRNDKTRVNVTDFYTIVIRRTIHRFYLEEKCVPTVGKFRTNLAASTTTVVITVASDFY
jgi:hypothetical protein